MLSDWLLRLLGVDASGVPDGATTEFVWTHAPRSWGVFVLIAIVLAVMWAVAGLYRRELAPCPRPLKAMLAALRIAVLALLAVVWLGPALAISTQRELEPYVVLLIDESLSMSLADRYADDAAAEPVAAALGADAATVRAAMPTRAALVEHLLQRDDAALVRQLAAKGKLRVLSFAHTVQQRRVIDLPREVAEPPEAQRHGRTDDPQPPPEPLPPLEPTGPSTNIAQAVREALRSLSGHPIAAVVLITDGQNTEGDDPRPAADLASAHGVPIYTVGIGDPSPSRNLRVAEVWAPDSVFQDDPFIVQAQLRAEGMDAASAEVELIGRPVLPDGRLGAERSLDRQTAAIGDGGARVTFEHKPTEPGDYVISVRLTPQPGELLAEDNVRSVTVKVLSDQARVLLIAGSPSWEYRMVSRLLIRDKTTDVSCFCQSWAGDMRQEGDTVIERLPVTAEALFEYDVLLLMDPDPRAFDEPWIDLLERFVGEHAGGVMWMAGPQYTAQFLTHFRTRGILGVLPVRVGELGALDVESLMTTHTQAWPLRVTAAGADHALLRMDKDPAINRRLWEAMPGVYWSFPAREARPAAQTLLEHSDPRLNRREGPRPLLIAGQYGPGRTVYVGFAGTWRWRKLGEAHFDRFWIQTVRYLVEGRLLGGRKLGRIGTDRDVYAVGGRVAITARLLDPSYRPLEKPAVTAVLTSPGVEDRTIELHPVPNRPGHYQATTLATGVGLNEITLTLDDGSGGGAQVGRQFTVELPRVEFADPRLDRQLLVDLADRSGGRYFPIDQVAALPPAIDAPVETIILRARPIHLWDTDRLLIVLVVLLTVEWALRKRFKLL